MLSNRWQPMPTNLFWSVSLYGAVSFQELRQTTENAAKWLSWGQRSLLVCGCDWKPVTVALRKKLGSCGAKLGRCGQGNVDQNAVVLARRKAVPQFWADLNDPRNVLLEKTYANPGFPGTPWPRAFPKAVTFSQEGKIVVPLPIIIRFQMTPHKSRKRIVNKDPLWFCDDRCFGAI